MSPWACPLNQPRWLLFLETLVLVLLIGAIDFVTGYEISLYVFYSIPILLAVLFLGKNAAVAVSIFSAVVWSTADIVGRSSDLNLERLWNMTAQLIFFLFIVLGGAALKGQRDESRARAALLERFHTLAQISPVGIFRLALDGGIIYVNDRWKAIAGFADTQALPPQWTAIFHPDDRERLAKDWEKASAERRQYEFEARIAHADRGTVWVLGQVASEFEGHDGQPGFVGAITDMTEQRRLEREVLEISEREQQRIGQDLHDDLCQQLVAIQYSAAALKKHVGSVDPQAMDAAREISDLLKKAVVQARQMARRIFPVSLDQMGLMAALQELAANSARFFSIQCEFVCDEPVFVEDDATGTHLFRIAQEALSNAVRHGRAERVEISLSSDDDALTLRIRDCGVGLPERRGDSTGMGLHIMHYRARMIGATLQVERHPAGGTLVECTVPQGGRRLRARAANSIPTLSDVR